MASSSFFWSCRAHAEVAVSVGEFRVEFDGLAVGGDGLVQLLLVAQGVAEVVEGGDRMRTNGHGRGVEPNRPFVVLLLRQSMGQAEIEPEISRVDVLGVPQKPEGGVRLLGSLESCGPD